MKLDLKKYFAEGFLIVFSVLFALFMNKLYLEYQTDRKKNIAIESITKELYRNQAIVEIWKKNHVEVKKRIMALVEGKNDSLKSVLSKHGYFNLGALTKDESLVDAILTKTAWESAKITGIISEFDFVTIQKLTQAYDMQDMLIEGTLAKILDYYFSSEAHKKENIDQTLIQFQLHFIELTGQEELMDQLYQQAIDQFEN